MARARIDGARIAYDVEGEGPPIVFLHCWTGNKAFFFEQVGRFSPRYRCVCLDFPGHGDSEESEPYTIERFTDITLGLMKKLGIEKAVFAGHSLGGLVCLDLALEHPEMVEGIILLDTTSHLSGFLFQKWAAYAGVVMGSFGSRFLEHLGFEPAKGLVAGIAATHPLARPRSRLITARECRKVSNRALVKTLDSLRKFDMTDRLGEVTQQTLIVVGTVDMLADVRHARRMARGIPNSVLKIVRGAGHMALFERPQVVNEAIEDFLNRTYPFSIM